MRSMTGYGEASVPIEDGKIVAELRSVNQRYLDIRVRLPGVLSEFCLFAEQLVRERCRRGRIELCVRAEGRPFASVALDRDRARAAYASLCDLRDEMSPGAEVPLSLLSVVPDLFVAPSSLHGERIRGALAQAISRAIVSVQQMCDVEGAALRTDFLNRLAELRMLHSRIELRGDGLKEQGRNRLRERLARLLAGSSATLDPSRLETEISLLAERTDVTEELARLGSHLDQFEVTVCREDEPVGKRLDFLLQEMFREANTIGSKAQDAALSQEAVEIKVQLERLREQVQNIE